MGGPVINAKRRDAMHCAFIDVKGKVVILWVMKRGGFTW
jgi:hypothetical protein